MKKPERTLLRISAFCLIMLLLLTTVGCKKEKNGEEKALADVSAPYLVTEYNELETEKLFGAFRLLDGVSGDVTSHAGSLALFSGVTTAVDPVYGTFRKIDYTVVDLDAAKVVYTFPSGIYFNGAGYDYTPRINLYECGVFLMYEEEDGTTVYTLYGRDGRMLLTDENPILVSGETVSCGSMDYAVENNGLSLSPLTSDGKPTMYTTPAAAEQHSESTHILMTGNTVTLYDTDDRPIAYWAAPSYADIVHAFPLNNGNVLLQYFINVPQIDGIKLENDEFDFEQGDAKYRMFTMILDAAAGKTSEITFDYCVESLQTAYDLNKDRAVVNDTVQNVAILLPIIDKKIDIASGNNLITLMDNDASLMNCPKWQVNQNGLPELMHDNCFIVRGNDGRRILYDAGGNVIGDVTGSSLYRDYIVSSNAVFDYTGKLLLDYAKDKLNLAYGYDEYLLFSTETDGHTVYKALVNGILRTIADGETERFIDGSRFGIVTYKPTDDTYHIMNADFAETAVLRFEPRSVLNWEDGVLFSAGGRYYTMTAGGGPVYRDPIEEVSRETQEDGTTIYVFSDGTVKTVHEDGRSSYEKGEAETMNALTDAVAAYIPRVIELAPSSVLYGKNEVRLTYSDVTESTAQYYFDTILAYAAPTAVEESTEPSSGYVYARKATLKPGVVITMELAGGDWYYNRYTMHVRITGVS